MAEDRATTLSRFWPKVTEREDDCWDWSNNGCRGYGRFWWNGRSWAAHRAAYTLLIGPIPEGLHLDHLCRNRRCVNPNHLEPVTPGENQRRSDLTPLGRTHCKNGHPLSGENLRLTGPNSRRCRTCLRLYSNEAKQERRRREVRRDISCPACGAAPGERCLTATGNRYRDWSLSHTARFASSPAGSPSGIPEGSRGE